jgi:hypothetical protein
VQIRIEGILEAFDEALELVEDEQQRERFARVLAASRASVERSVHELVAGVAEEVNEALGDRVQVNLTYGSEGATINVSAPPLEEDEDDETLSFRGDEVEKLTLRLPPELKERATGAAAQAGVSLNSWIVRVLARELAGGGGAGRRGGRGGRRRGRGAARLKGWIGG